MNILLCTGIFPPDIGGPATYSKLLSDMLPERGVAVEVLSFGSVRRLPKVIRHIVYFFHVLRRGSRCDIIYAQDPVSVGFPALVAARIVGKKFMIRIAGDYAWEQARERFGVEDGIDEFQTRRYGKRVETLRSVQRFVAAHADSVIAPSQYFRTLVAGWVRDPRKVIAIYNGISFPAYYDDVPYEQRDRVIISAGRLVPWKGFDALIRMMAELPDWRLVIVGDGPDRARLEDSARSCGCTERVTFIGSVPREHLASLLLSSRIFVLNTSFESFSFQIVEALYYGIPVVATNIGNLAEIVTSGTDGILVAPDDRPAIAAAIGKIDKDGTFRDSLVSHGKKKATQFSIERTLSELVAVMNRVVGKSNGS